MLKCNECRFKRDIPGDAHVACSRPVCITYNVNEHGVEKGWFNYPLNFDPVWAEGCTGFAPKGMPEDFDRKTLEELFASEVGMVIFLTKEGKEHLLKFSPKKTRKWLEGVRAANDAIPEKEDGGKWSPGEIPTDVMVRFLHRVWAAGA